MWHLSADNGDIIVLFKTKEDLWQYIELGSFKEFSIRWIPVWTPPPEVETASKKITLTELVPLSRAKEEN